MNNMVSVIFVLAAVAQLVPVLAQGLTLPTCGVCTMPEPRILANKCLQEICFVDALPTSNCSVTNVECLCADAAFSAALIDCVRKTCMPKDGLGTAEKVVETLKIY